MRELVAYIVKPMNESLPAETFAGIANDEDDEDGEIGDEFEDEFDPLLNGDEDEAEGRETGS